MKRFALAGNPNSGKTTLFNSLTGSSAHVGNWPGVTVDKKDGVYKKLKEVVSIIDLPGIYSLSPYTSEEVIARNYIIKEKPDCIINIIDATNIERNLYLATQVLEIDVPVVIALNMIDSVEKSGDYIDSKELEKLLGVPVIEISALKKKNLDRLMEVAYKESFKKRKGANIFDKSKISDFVKAIKAELETKNIDNTQFHALKIIEKDELETQEYATIIEKIDKYNNKFNDKIFNNDVEAYIADFRYKFITNNLPKFFYKNEDNKKISSRTKSDKIDRVLTNKWLGIPIFIAILFVVFHLTFSEDLLFLNTFGFLGEEGIVSFPNTIFKGLLADGGINSPGVILFNLLEIGTKEISVIVNKGLISIAAPEWVVGFIGDGVLGGLIAVIGFLPQILLLFLFFSILEDTGYMARVAFILDRIFRKFGLSGRSFLPMIMGFGCSVPAMINTRTLINDREKIATIRVIPFFSCGAKLPILTAIAGGIAMSFNLGNVDLITLGMYFLGIIVAMVSVFIMMRTTLKGEVSPFIMELPNYHLPQFSSLMIHLWDKAKHFIKKAFTVILISTIFIWFIMHFSLSFQYLGDEYVDQSILAGIGKVITPIFTPLGFGVQLSKFAWVFVVASIMGLIAKENVIGAFGTLAATIVTGFISPDGETIEGLAAVQEMIKVTGIGVPGLLSFIAFNMLTIPCFAACATAKAELPKGKFFSTIVFWIATSYVVSSVIYLVCTWWWTSIIVAFVVLLIYLIIRLVNKNMLRRI